MPSADLSALYRLHRIDRELVELKLRAASYDPTREVRAEIDAFRPEYDEVVGRYKATKAQAEEAENHQRAIDEKLKRLDKELYGGTIVNPREVAAYEAEIATLKAKRQELDEQLLELWDALPTLLTPAKTAQTRMKQLKEVLEQRRAEGLAEQERMKARYADVARQRPPAASAIPKPLLAQYDAIRQRQGGIGMSEVSDRHACTQCGNLLAERIREAVSRDQLTTCESCHRILIQVVPDA